MPRSVVIVGAGPAGMAAAIEAVKRGCRVTVVDEAGLPGGQIYRQANAKLDGADYAETGELERKKALLKKFNDIVGMIDFRPGASVYALYDNGEIHIDEGANIDILRPDAIVLATGVREVAFPFPGWTTPGVMFAGGIQAILKSQRVVPGKKIVVAGSGALPMVVAAQIIRAGGSVAALANLNPLSKMLKHPGGLWCGREIVREGLRYAWTVFKSDTERLPGFVPLRAIGTDRLQAVVLGRVDAEGRPVKESEREIACDLLAINYGFAANSELAAMAGASMRYDRTGGGWAPEVDEFGRTSVARIHAAGDGAGLRGALVAECEGTIVGAGAATEPGNDAALRASLADLFAARRKHLQFQRAVRQILEVPLHLWQIASDDTTICRCENVSLAEMKNAFARGHSSLNELKRNLRSGMGWCGGRTCLPFISVLVEATTGKPPATMMTPRPVARPVSFAALAMHKQRNAS